MADSSRYYLLSARELTVGQTVIGQALVFTDITEVERHREQLDDFSEAITHELRNALNIVQDYPRLAGMRLDPDGDASVTDSITTARETADRMMDIVDDPATLARFGQPVDELARVEIAPIAREA